MSTFRELDFDNDTLIMKPAKEYESLRKHCFDFDEENKSYSVGDDRAFDLETQNFGDKFDIEIFDTLKLDFDSGRGDFELSFIANGYGRDARYIRVKKIENLRLMIDASSVEVFVNDGKYVMSNRMYPSEYKDIKVNGNITGKLYKLDV